MTTILILEDDQPLAAEWQIALEGEGYTVVHCRDATSALDYLEGHDADLVIADIFIYREGTLTSDGGVKLVGLLRAAGARTERPDLPIISITGQPQDGRFVPPVLDLTTSLGADLALEKPVPIPDLLGHVRSLIGSRDAQGTTLSSAPEQAERDADG
ncbi:response regulator [Pontivivens ytuae]|uniref:Response regulator n=1 Tax=Pontivivens ytuae TaxID=2789856 RepID=A0A7S9QC60_9RHOB|nr:response regulator [Pontivivens ytuae]QPH53868.1 response regulator [Pontivivens ytuae]